MIVDDDGCKPLDWKISEAAFGYIIQILVHSHIDYVLLGNIVNRLSNAVAPDNTKRCDEHE